MTKQEDFLLKEGILSPEKEAMYLKKFNTAMIENANLKEENYDLKQQLANLKKLIYGQKSEKTEVVFSSGEQINIFNEAENEESKKVRENESPIVVPEHKRKSKRTHEEIMADLPVEEVVHTLEDKTCPKCGTEMKNVGKEFVRDELIYVPASIFVRKHYIEVLKCTSCGTDESVDAALADIERSVFKKAEAPSPMISNSFCSPELLAHIVYEKYCQSVPLYRQERDFSQMGIGLSRTTMANWIIYTSERWIYPLWQRMKRDLLAGSVIHADETVVQVLHEPGKKATSESRMWAYCNGKINDHSNILFEYQPTRNGDHAVNFLGDFNGYLVCDGYAGYNKLYKVKRCGCMAHVRRKFVEALPLEKELHTSSQAARGVEWCNKLFHLESEFEKLSPEERYIQRQERSKDTLDGFFQWLDTVSPNGGSKLFKAVSYAKNEKKNIYRFLESPDVPISNNRIENCIRPFCIGRANWKFCDSVKGAKASAMFYSLAATVCANGLNIENYFAELFRQKPGTMHLPWKNLSSDKN